MGLQDLKTAPIDDLPEILRNPPWPRKATDADAVVDGLAVPAEPHRMDWTAEQRTAWHNSSKVYLAVLDSPDAETSQELGVRLTRMDADAIDALAPTLTKKELKRLEKWVIPALLKRGIDILPVALRFSHAPKLILQVLEAVDSVHAAPTAARLATDLEAEGRRARQWLVDRPEAAARGLLPAAVGPHGDDRETARAALRHVVLGGHGGAVESAVEGADDPSAVGAALVGVLDAGPLGEVPDELPDMPDFWDVDALPRPTLADGRALPVRAVESIGQMLAFTPLDTPYVGLRRVVEACDPASLARFAQGLFDAWLDAGAEASERWAFFGLAWFGDDGAALALEPLIRAWPKQKHHQRALWGLEVLVAQGSSSASKTDTALGVLHRLSQLRKPKALAKAAAEHVDALARIRGLDADQLGDRLEPTVERLEQALARQRRWSVEEFERHVVEQPAWSDAVRRLLWGAYDADCGLRQVFRLDDHQPVDADGGSIDLPAESTVGLVHPLDLDGASLERWTEVWRDLGLEPPFPQLDRPVERLDEAALATTSSKRFVGTVVPTPVLLPLLERGWRQGEFIEGGVAAWIAWPFVGGDGRRQEVRLHFEPGLHANHPLTFEEQTLGELWVSDAAETWKSRPSVPLGDVPMAVLSEALVSLGALG